MYLPREFSARAGESRLYRAFGVQTDVDRLPAALHRFSVPDRMTTHTLRSILATSDLTVSSEPGLTTSAAIAGACGAELHAFHCVPAPVIPYLDESARARARESAREDLDRQLRQVLGEDARVASVEADIGEPARQINARAEQVRADLIVLGAHRPRAGIGDLLGTTADRVIRTATVPCLVANREMVGPLRRVLIAIDFSPPSLRALDVGLDWLVTLTARNPDDTSTTAEVLYISARATPTYRTGAIEPKLAEQAARIRERLEGTRIRALPRVLSAPQPVDGIERAARQSRADLIILGTHGYGALGRALLGSVASAVVRTVPFPILLVPPVTNGGR